MRLESVTTNRRAWLPALAVAALIATALPARAQARFGVQFGLSTDEYGFGIGLREWIPTVARLDLIGSAGCFFRALRDNALDVNLDAAYRFSSSPASLLPYAGVGLGLTHHPVTYKPTTPTVNLIAGTRFRQRSKGELFLELRLKIAVGYNHFAPDAAPVAVIGGFLF